MERAKLERSRHRRSRIATFGMAILAVLVLPFADMTSASAATLDRVRQSGKLMLGYRTDARPFAYQDGAGKATGYSIELCQKVADEVKAEAALPALTVEWVPVTIDDRFRAVQDGRVDLLCGGDTATLTRRKEVAFSIPIFQSGIGALLRADSPAELRDVLSGRSSSRPIWRASPALILENKTFSAVKGTTSESWLAGRLDKFKIPATVAIVDDYDAGVQKVLERSSDVFFADRHILLDAAEKNPSVRDLDILDRTFTSEPLALVLARNDDDFRLVVDRTLSRLFKGDEFRDIYVKWFGEPDENALTFFQLSALPD